MGNEVPSEPLLFLKPPSALVGVGAPIVLPSGVGQVDYEGEIGVVMGEKASHVMEEEAMGFVAGIVPVNDVTARDLQRRDNQWSRAKGFDTFCPVGEPVALGRVDLANLSVLTRVNGEERQRASIDLMVFSISYLISYVSRIMTWEPGDLLLTGTPEGVGPLSEGDVVEVELPDLATLTNPVIRGPEI
jgi:2-keto-4-pentenoate hydratase/2-oxohepta-3-ene-1,7-dioic acid hydratase in catechol pathway